MAFLLNGIGNAVCMCVCACVTKWAEGARELIFCVVVALGGVNPNIGADSCFESCVHTSSWQFPSLPCLPFPGSGSRAVSIWPSENFWNLVRDLVHSGAFWKQVSGSSLHLHEQRHNISSPKAAIRFIGSTVRPRPQCIVDTSQSNKLFHLAVAILQKIKA